MKSINCKIKVIDSNAQAIEDTLRKINGRAHLHTYTTYAEIAAVAANAEKALGRLLYKKAFPGAEYTSESGIKVANKYSYMLEATRVRLTRGSKDWFLVSIASSMIGTQGGRSDQLYLTSEQDEAAKAKLAEGYNVLPSAAVEAA